MTKYLSKNESTDIWDEAMKFRPDFMEENEQKKKEELDIYYKIEKCKICKTEVKLSCKYSGKFPLCYKHRNPNERK